MGDKVAFTAHAVSGVRAYARNETIIFDATVVNVGGAFNSTTSVFTCPAHGLYLFTFSLYSLHYRHVEGTLTLNDVEVVAAVAGYFGWSQASNAAVVECQAGDTVKVIAGPQSANNVLSNEFYAPLNTFTGVLLHTM